MLIYASMMLLYDASSKIGLYASAVSIAVLAQNVCHWTVTMTYLKTTVTAAAVLDQDAHLE